MRPDGHLQEKAEARLTQIQELLATVEAMRDSLYQEAKDIIVSMLDMERLERHDN